VSRYSRRTGGSLISVSSRIPWPGKHPQLLPDGVRAAPLPCGRTTLRQSLTPAKTCCRGSRIHQEKPMNYYGEMARDHWARWLPGSRDPPRSRPHRDDRVRAQDARLPQAGPLPPERPTHHLHAERPQGDRRRRGVQTATAQREGCVKDSAPARPTSPDGAPQRCGIGRPVASTQTTWATSEHRLPQPHVNSEQQP